MSARSSLFFLLLPCLFSCAAGEVHLQDRHGLSYPVVEAFAKSHRGTTLVLLDYHHDVGTPAAEATSANWVGILLSRDLLSRVIWVSGRDLLLPNRNSRMDWLGRNLAAVPPSDALRMAERITLADWSELKAMRFSGPLAVSFDLDVLCHDPGEPAERFLDELVAWTSARRPALVTVALSAAYQRSADAAWSWLERFAGSYRDAGEAWYLEAGPYAAIPEGAEEAAAWELWSKIPDAFARYGRGFWPGAGIWIGAPPSLRAKLAGRDIRAGDRNAAAVLSAWGDPDRAELEAEFPEERLRSLAAAAAESLEAAWRGAALAEPEACAADRGIATRLLRAGVDRGCLALYRGVADAEAAARYCAQQAAADPRYPPVLAGERNGLAVEVSVFGRWREMSGPLDFAPGADSLLVQDGRAATLLQSSLAVERGYDREAFLAVLSKKAGLGKEGWKQGGLVFKRAPTIWYLRSMAGLAADQDGESQKNVKK